MFNIWKTHLLTAGSSTRRALHRSSYRSSGASNPVQDLLLPFKRMKLNATSLNCRFTKAISDGINVVREGAMLSLEVQRQRGSFRDVHVRWEITPNAGIANASSQISPMNGTISFRQVSVLSPHLQTFLRYPSKW